MSPRSYLLRLIVPFTVLIVAVVAGAGAIIYFAAQRTQQQQQIDDLDRIVELARPMIATDAAGAPTSDTLDRLAHLGRIMQVRVSLIGADGQVVFDTETTSPQTLGDQSQRAEVAQARRGGRGWATRRSATTDRPSVFVAVAADPANPAGAIVRAAADERPWTRLSGSAWIVLITAVLAASLAMSGLAFLLHRWWIAPVRRITEAATKLAAGDWHFRADLRGADELRHLAERLNAVALQAQKQMNDIRHQRGDLQALVDALPDPILLTDPGARIRVINLPAARLLKLDPHQALGRKLITVVNDATVLHLFDAVAEHQPPDSDGQPVVAHSSEVRIARDGKRSTYQAMVNRTAQGGVLLVLRDISTLAGAVQMKTDFVANASHELRTPIAAIKMGFETLKDVWDDEDHTQAERCLAIIEGHLARLEEMLRDLLDLSRVESADLKPHLSPVRASELELYLRSVWQHTADQKGVSLVFEIADEDVEFVSDRRLLDLILKNLIENSLKFTPPAGSVTLTIRPADDGGVIMSVRDTGIGIPQEHIDRVFERFYQVDPARSGSAGRGTGLGLAIVKHAAHALAGSITLESQLGKGTIATVHLPPLNTLDAHEVR